MDSSILDLPPGAARDIIGRARGRLIPGTNRYALVCKAWLEASPTETDDEQLQLYLDQAAVNDDQLHRAAWWLSQHGKGVAGLELPTTTWGFVKTTLSYPGISSSLQRLHVRGTNTLVGLLAAQVQLPRLQHLTACLSVKHTWQVEPGVVLLEEGDVEAGALHLLQQACPGLKDLCLYLYGEWNGMQQPGRSNMDAILPRLLPPTLQQLAMDYDWVFGDDAHITPHLALGHLTGLQRLELRAFRVRDPTSFLQLPPGCELNLVACKTNDELATLDDWRPLGERITALSMPCINDDVTGLSHLTQLTSLWADTDAWETDSELPLAGLTALLQLHLAGDDLEMHEERAHQALLQVTSTSSLRHLGLRIFSWDTPALLSALGALTQLTSLCLDLDWWFEAQTVGGVQGAGQQQVQVGGGQLVEEDAPPAEAGLPVGPLWTLQGLVGLRQLQLSCQPLLCYPTAWLSHLTQLMLLMVDFSGYRVDGVRPGLSSCVAAVVPRLQSSHPASLQQVVLYLEGTPVCDVVPSLLPGVAVGVRPRTDDAYYCMPRAPRPMQPCAHLPGVWELLPEQTQG
jgi:hypothetical protein